MGFRFIGEKLPQNCRKGISGYSEGYPYLIFRLHQIKFMLKIKGSVFIIKNIIVKGWIAADI